MNFLHNSYIMKKNMANKRKSCIKKKSSKKNQNVKFDLSKNLVYEPPHKKIDVPFYTALFFITNMVTAFYREYYTYAALFLVLTITSLFAHSSDNVYANIIDKFAVFLIVTYGGYILYNKLSRDKICIIIGAIISFLLVIILYVYGNFKKCFCFHPDECKAKRCHGLLHFISSLGHHLIIFA